jgi:acyl carrier protein
MDVKQLASSMDDALNLPSGTVREEDRLEDLEGWDSIGVIAVMAVIEDQYGVSLDPEGLAKCQTAGDLFRLVQECCKTK